MFSSFWSWFWNAAEPERHNTEKEEVEKHLFKNELWYPKADVIPGQRSRGEYPLQYPEFAIVHYTAGRREYRNLDEYSSGLNAMQYSIRQNSYAYFVIGFDGTVLQSLPLNKWGYHAGKAYHDGLNTSSVSKRGVGIEVCCAGGPLTYVSKGGKTGYESWYGEKYSENQVRIKTKAEYMADGGAYLKFTEAQEKSLEDLLIWLAGNNRVFSIGNIRGHHEVSPRRKNDPGPSLSYPMREYRSYLLNKFN